MKFRGSIILGAAWTAMAVLVLSPFSIARQVEKPPGQEFRQANKKTIHAYIMLIRLRSDLLGRWKDTGKWPDDKKANRALQEHSKYWQERLKGGQALVAAGMNGDYWDNVAFIIFEAPSIEEARKIVAADPAVKAYVFQAQVRPLDVHFISDKYSVAPGQ